MPINSIQFRAEIGQFNNAFQRIYSTTALPFVTLIASIINLFLVECHNYNNLFHLVCIIIILMLFPFIFSLTLIFSNLFNLYNIILIFYINIYIWLRFIFNLLWATIAYHKAFCKFLVRYYFFFQICVFVPFIRLALLISGDIETNPGPERCNQNISLCHWNLNGIAANNFVKISLLEAYNSLHDFDIICISESFLDSNYSNR